jgi:hypothetical protein
MRNRLPNRESMIRLVTRGMVMRPMVEKKDSVYFLCKKEMRDCAWDEYGNPTSYSSQKRMMADARKYRNIASRQQTTDRKLSKYMKSVRQK